MTLKKMYCMAILLCIFAVAFAQYAPSINYQAFEEIIIQAIGDVMRQHGLTRTGSGSPTQRIALADITVSFDFSEEAENRFYRLIEQEFARRRNIIVIERNRVDTFIRDRAFRQGREVDIRFEERELIALGEQLDVDFVVNAEIEGGRGVPYAVTIEMTNVKNFRKATATKYLATQY